MLKFNSRKHSSYTTFLLIYFIGTSAEITQLACIFEEETFNRYVLPKSPISAKATAVTGLHVASGQLFYQQTKVNSVDIQTCLTEFNIWLKNFPNPILVCHNGKVFDSVILMRYVMQYPESGLKSTIAGFVDSLHVFREILPEQHSYKLQTLVQDTMGLAFNAHSALEDVKALQSLVLHHKVSYEIMLKHSFGVDFIISSIESKSKTNELIATLAPLSSCISPYMLKKIALSGLSYDHLRLAIERGGADGLKMVLGEKTEQGTVRVTKNKTIVGKIYDHFC